MSVIQPLPAIRYNTTGQTDLSSRLAPPYDVLSEGDKAQLLTRDSRNFVKIDLPFVPPKSAGPAAVYESARREMDAWLADGVLVRDPQPAIYVYHQRFARNGATCTRKMFFARLRLEPFGAGSVFPHEQTFGGPKEDRLCLTKACQANLSPIFGLYPDSRNDVSKTLDAARTPKPLATGTLDNVENELWAVTDPGTIARVQQLLADKPTFIADGHHRYGTGLLYRDWLISQQGTISPEHAANYVLCVFCAMEDPGLLILPTHRVLPGVKLPADVLAADRELAVAPLDVNDPTAAVTALAKFGPQAVGLYDSATHKYHAIRPARADILAKIAPEHSPAWRALGLAFLHAYLLDRVVTPHVCGGTAPEIRYVKTDPEAVSTADETRGVAFLLQPTTLAEMSGVCQAGDLMPQKSRFFYPKLASGLIINPLV